MITRKSVSGRRRSVVVGADLRRHDEWWEAGPPHALTQAPELKLPIHQLSDIYVDLSCDVTFYNFYVYRVSNPVCFQGF